MLRRSRWLDLVLTLLLLGLIGAIVLRLDAIETVAALGVPEVVDGDSLVLNGVRIRLQGIDAPEIGQTCLRPGRRYDCGREAKAKMRALINGRKVNCSGWQRDKYLRLLSNCVTGSLSLNRTMVASGWAVAYGDYAAEEAAARRAKLGLWEGDFDRPQEWRKMKGTLLESPHDFWLKVRGYLSMLTGYFGG